MLCMFCRPSRTPPSLSPKNSSSRGPSVGSGSPSWLLSRITYAAFGKKEPRYSEFKVIGFKDLQVIIVQLRSESNSDAQENYNI